MTTPISPMALIAAAYEAPVADVTNEAMLDWAANLEEAVAAALGMLRPAPANGGDRWWVLPDEVLRDLVGRAHAGENPGALIAELYANSDTEGSTQ